MRVQNLSFVGLPTNISAGYPTYLNWTGNRSPVNLTLWSNESPGMHLVSHIVDNYAGQSYMWTPSTSLSDGHYEIGLSEEDTPDMLSGGITVSHDKIDNTISTSSKISIPSATSPPSTIGSSSSLNPVTVTPTLSSTPIPASSTPQSLNTQQNSTPHHTPNGGAIAGIAIGAVVFILLIFSSAILRFRRRRRFSQKAVSELPSHTTDAEVKSDPGTTMWVPELGQEGAVYGPHELPGISMPAGSGHPEEGVVVETGDSR